jgi:hypothetical protein
MTDRGYSNSIHSDDRLNELLNELCDATEFHCQGACQSTG